MKAILILSFLGIFQLGFTLMGTNPSLKGFDTKKLTFHLNPANCPISETLLKQAIEDAMNLWNSVPTSSLEIVLGSDTNESASAIYTAHTSQSGEPVMVCSTNLSSDTGQSLDANVIVGIGFNGTQNGRIVNGGLLLNAESGASANIANQSQTTLSIVIAHEMAHTLGIGHSSDPESIMNYSVGEKTALRLSQDDIDALSYLYPRQEIASQLPLGCASTLWTLKPPSQKNAHGFFNYHSKPASKGIWNFQILEFICLWFLLWFIQKTYSFSFRKKAH